MSSTLIVVLMLSFSASAVTTHHSFRTREAGIVFGTGTTGVAYPILVMGGMLYKS